MRKLWNRPDYPVWSLVTKDSAGVFNMNICSYVSAVSLKPKVMMIAVYQGTKTRDNLLIGKAARLQLLAETQAPIIRLLGQQSGKSVSKLARLEKRGLIEYRDGWPYLVAATGYLDLVVTKIIEVGLDHDLALGTVTHHHNLSEAKLLTTTYLKDNKFIR